MRKAIGAIAACVALALVLLPPALASAGQPSGLRGVVLDATCFGPCIVDGEQRPYAGPDLRIAIRRLPGGGLVRRLSPDGGRFSTRLRPGLYRLNAYVNSGPCWEAEAKRVRVRRGQFRQLTLHVANTCILCAEGACPPCGPCPPCVVDAQGVVICPPCPLPAAVICEPCPPGQVCVL